MNLAGTPVVASSIPEAWVRVTRLVNSQQRHAAFHTTAVIEDPLKDDADVRALLDSLYEADDYETYRYPVASVAGTIFPSRMAARTSTPEELTTYYRERYAFLQKFPANRRGTYFGRISETPPSGGPDQLVRTIKKINEDRKYHAIYELESRDPAAEMFVYDAGRDIGNHRGFPCMSFCSVQRDGNHLHMVAHYRSQAMISRAYGNYVGLGMLLGYIAANTGLEVGRLTVVAGFASVDGKQRVVKPLLQAADRVLRANTVQEGAHGI